MPMKSEKIPLPEHLDRRRRLSSEQKAEIQSKYATGFYSLSGLAREYGVSKKTVLLIVNPESKRKNDEYIKTHWRQYAALGDERNAIMREYRQRKQRLYLDGELKTGEGGENGD